MFSPSLSKVSGREKSAAERLNWWHVCISPNITCGFCSGITLNYVSAAHVQLSNRLENGEKMSSSPSLKTQSCALVAALIFT